jgi:murein DD-endopeptidase MepM/ murein hydrolase activator NlpD
MHRIPFSIKLLLSLLVIFILVSAYFLYQRFRSGDSRSANVLAWLRDSKSHPEWAMQPAQRCGDSPFIFPTYGLVGYLWGDSFRPGHRHQGIDTFGGAPPGETPIIAAYSGYLTRLPDWKSSVIIRIPHDPLQPERQIWTYYTHMADSDGNSFIDPAFPPSTREIYVEAGTLLGYQGNYSGDPFNPTGVHLHFSIVLDDNGRFRNELEYSNTLDPSPYFGLPLNAASNPNQIPLCPTSAP